MKFDHSMFMDIISGRQTGILAAATRFLLTAASVVYRSATQLRNWAYDHEYIRTNRVKVPVISIGNLTAGGTGKTPFVIWLAQHLEQTCQIAIISRGYHSEGKPLNDEGLEIQHRLPEIVQIQNADRLAAASKAAGIISENARAAATHPVVLLDDGFQHRRLARDTDIVLIDSTCPFGYGYLLPRGLLREPVASIKRADLAILTRANLVSDEERMAIRTRLLSSNPRLSIAEAEVTVCGLLTTDGQTHSLKMLDGQRLFAFCGIGNPDSFLKTLDRENLNVVGSKIFDDHYSYGPEDLRSVVRLAKQLDCDSVICTHKDLVKLDFDATETLPIFALLTQLRMTAGSEIVEQTIAAALPELKDSRRDESPEPLTHR